MLDSTQDTSLVSHFLSEDLINSALHGVIDPELGINIIDLGLVYQVSFNDEGKVFITMTLTTPGCPMHATFAQDIEETLFQSIPGLTGVDVNLVWEPRWDPTMISDEGLAELGLI
ncbi:MAG: metal-sulfur cluster assembly factor [Anaerolineae bacterium]|nr:metal-sulfur cluster assembly factor [Anaerolineae bacterium]